MSNVSHVLFFRMRLLVNNFETENRIFSPKFNTRFRKSDRIQYTSPIKKLKKGGKMVKITKLASVGIISFALTTMICSGGVIRRRFQFNRGD